MELLKNNVCAPKGFRALGKFVGIKKNGKPDLGVIYSDVAAAAATTAPSLGAATDA